MKNRTPNSQTVGGHYLGTAWRALNLDSKTGSAVPQRRYQTIHMCGDKWANIFCQILRPKPRGSCRSHWKPTAWLSPVGLMSLCNGRASRAVCVCTVCLCTRLWHNSGRDSQYKWSRRCLAQRRGGYGADGESGPRGWWGGLIPDRDQRTSGGTCSADSCTHPLALFPGVPRRLPPQHML